MTDMEPFRQPSKEEHHTMQQLVDSLVEEAEQDGMAEFVEGDRGYITALANGVMVGTSCWDRYLLLRMLVTWQSAINCTSGPDCIPTQKFEDILYPEITIPDDLFGTTDS